MRPTLAIVILLVKKNNTLLISNGNIHLHNTQKKCVSLSSRHVLFALDALILMCKHQSLKMMQDYTISASLKVVVCHCNRSDTAIDMYMQADKGCPIFCDPAIFC